MVERPAAGDAVRDGNRMDTGRLSRLHAVRGVLEGYRLRRAHLQAVQLHDPGTWSEPRDSVSTISPSKSKIRARNILHGSGRGEPYQIYVPDVETPLSMTLVSIRICTT